MDAMCRDWRRGCSRSESRRMRSIGSRNREVCLRRTASARIGDGFGSGIPIIRSRAVMGATVGEMVERMVEVVDAVADVDVLISKDAVVVVALVVAGVASIEIGDLALEK